MRNNYEILEGGDVIRFIKSRWIGWLEQVVGQSRQNGSIQAQHPKRILYSEIGGVGRVGRPRRRWL